MCLRSQKYLSKVLNQLNQCIRSQPNRLGSLGCRVSQPHETDTIGETHQSQKDLECQGKNQCFINLGRVLPPVFIPGLQPGHSTKEKEKNSLIQLQYWHRHKQLKYHL